MNTKVIPALTAAFGYLQAHTGQVKIAAAAIGALVAIWATATVVLKTISAAQTIYNAGSKIATGIVKAWTKAQWLWNAAMSANPLTIIIIGLVALGVALVIAYKKSETFRNIVQGALHGVIAAGKAVVHFITVDLWHAFLAAVGFAKKWGPLMLLAVAPVIAIPLLIWQHFSQIKKFVLRAFNGAIHWLTGPGASILSGMWSGIKSGWNASISWLSGMKDRIGGYFKNAGKWLYGAGGSVVSGLVKGVKNALSGLSNIFRTPLNFVIDNVVNKFIHLLWKIPGIKGVLHEIGDIPKFASGGALPVEPMVTNRPLAIVGEGNPAYPEYVIPTDPKFRKRALGLYEQAGYQLLWGGGILHSVTSTIGKGAGYAKDKVWQGVEAGAHGVRQLSGVVVGGLIRAAVKAANAAVGGVPGGQMFVSMADAVMGKIANAVEDWIKGKSHDAPAGNQKFHGSGNVASWVMQALDLLHLPFSQYGNGVQNIIANESGGNPNAVNNWDSNAKAGHPSKGLMQTIASTFAAYVLPSLRSRSIFDPIANITAGVRYAISRYGAQWLINGGNRTSTGAYKGYDSGGWLMPGHQLVYNGHKKPEAVLSPHQSSALMRIADRASSASAPVVHIANFNVADRTDADMVMNRLASTLSAVVA